MPPKKQEHEWTDFEKRTLLCLLVKGMHHQVRMKVADEDTPTKNRRYRSRITNSDGQSKFNIYLNISTALNDAINKGDYGQDIDKREVTKMIDRMLEQYKGVLGTGGLMERQVVPRITRGLRLAAQRRPAIDFNGTVGEWEMGRKKKELARREMREYRNKLAEWKTDHPDEEPPFADPSVKQSVEGGPSAGGVGVAGQGAAGHRSSALGGGDFYRPVYGAPMLVASQQGNSTPNVRNGGGYLDSRGNPIAFPSTITSNVSGPVGGGYIGTQGNPVTLPSFTPANLPSQAGGGYQGMQGNPITVSSNEISRVSFAPIFSTNVSNPANTAHTPAQTSHFKKPSTRRSILRNPGSMTPGSMTPRSDLAEVSSNLMTNFLPQYGGASNDYDFNGAGSTSNASQHYYPSPAQFTAAAPSSQSAPPASENSGRERSRVRFQGENDMGGEDGELKD